MSEEITPKRLSKAAVEYNVSWERIVEDLAKKGFKVEPSPNTKLTPEQQEVLKKIYASDKQVKKEADKIGREFTRRESITLDDIDNQGSIDEKDNTPPDLVIKNTQIREVEKQAPKKAQEPEEIAPVPEPVIIPEPEPEPQPVIATPVVELPVEVPEVVIEKNKPLPVSEPEPEIQPEPEVVAATESEPAKPEPIKEETIIEPIVSVQEEIPVVTEEIKEVDVQQATTKKTEIEIKDSKPSDDTRGVKVVGKIDLDQMNLRTKPPKKSKEERQKERDASRNKSREPVSRHDPNGHIIKPLPVVEKPVEPVEIAPVEDAEKAITDKKNALPDNFLARAKIKLEGPTILGTIVLPKSYRDNDKKKPVASSSDDQTKSKKKKRKRIIKPDQQTSTTNTGGNTGTNTNRPPQSTHTRTTDRPKSRKDNKKPVTSKEVVKPEVKEEEIQKQIKETLARLTSGGKSKASKHRKAKRDQASQTVAEQQQRAVDDQKTLKVTEFVTVNELASMMNVGVTQIIKSCMDLGLFVSINQRLDAETIVFLADEFGYKTEFVSIEVQEAIDESFEDIPEDYVFKAPIVTVMGHVDHGKTKLLDYIRSANVVAGEAGGITQHIGAYEVSLENGKKITFLDTPGHEAFTAMRARGAKLTDVAIIVIAADDSIMPQTREAINHALAASVPIVFAFNKIDKPSANTEKIRQELASMNILVEDWGGKYQCQEISAKTGIGIELLLEKVLLEAELLDLKANPKRPAMGTVIESMLDKGRGYTSKLLIQSGTLKVGDMVIAGTTYGKVKAMYNERNQSVKETGPASPILMLGLNGAPQAGDLFNVMSDEREVKSIALKRQQLQREQGLRTQKHITLDEIGRRIAIGDFKELNVIVKGDVDGSVEALSDSLLKLSTEEVQVNVIHKSVGQITESDVMLASASNAVIVGFQVRPSSAANKLADHEQIDIRLYSIIYKAIEEFKAAIEGMLSPKIEEKILCNLEIREVFHITKVGNIAGCFVLDGVIQRNTKVRVIRDGIVVHTGLLGALKRFKDEVKEARAGQECGLNIDRFNDIKVGDIIEGYEEVEVKRTLK
ncbi:MAG: translation initiation factor IF-2 [Bacteroidales bacterium]|nr:translation initiation factor IF-2 [Bacteroidales bacterium]